MVVEKTSTKNQYLNSITNTLIKIVNTAMILAGLYYLSSQFIFNRTETYLEALLMIVLSLSITLFNVLFLSKMNNVSKIAQIVCYEIVFLITYLVWVTPFDNNIGFYGILYLISCTVTLQKNALIISSVIYFITNIGYFIIKQNAYDFNMLDDKLIIGAVLTILCYMLVIKLEKSLDDNDESLSKIVKAKNETHSVVGSVTGKTEAVVNVNNDLNTNMATLLETMRQLVLANSQATSSTEHQAFRTQELKSHFEQVLLSIDNITSSIEDNTKALERSALRMKNLVEHSDKVSEEAFNVSSNIKETVNGVKQINTISTDIKGIADKMKLLSFNAGIITARENKDSGFSVIVDEIRTMSDKTKEFLMTVDNITKSFNFTEIFTSLNDLEEKNITQKKLASDTASILEEASKYNSNVNDIMGNMIKLLKSVYEKTEDITIETEKLSAISQQTYASAETTRKDLENNVEILNNVTQIIQQLVTEVNSLNRMY